MVTDGGSVCLGGYSSFGGLETRIELLETCFCFRLVGHCNKIPLMGRSLALRSSLSLPHGSFSRYIGFVASRYSMICGSLAGC